MKSAPKKAGKIPEVNIPFSVLNNIPLGIYMVNQGYEIEYVNQKLEADFGPVAGKKCFAYFHQRTSPCPWCKNREVFSGQAVRWEWYSERTKRTYDLIDVPVKNPDGSVSKLEIFNDITDRKQGEEELRALNEKNTWLIDSLNKVPSYVYIKDRNSKYIYANDLTLELFQCGKDDLPGAADNKFFPVDTVKKLREIDLRVLSGETTEEEIEINYESKTVFFLERKYPLRDKNGSIYGVCGVSTDITERKKLEEGLKENEIRFRSVVESSPYGIIISVGRDEKVEYLSQKFSDLFGYTLEDIPSVSAWWPQAYPDEGYRSKVRPLWEKIVESSLRNKNEAEPIETKVVCKDGTEKHVQFTFTHAGKKNIIFCIDLTARKKIEDDLRANKGQLSNALTIAHLGPWEYDVENDIFTFNDAFYAIFRTTAEKSGGYTMPAAEYTRRFLHPEDGHLVAIETRKAIETQDPYFSSSLDHRIIYADGEIGYISVRFFIIKDENGRTIKTYGVNQDITERKKLEERLQKSLHEMETFYKVSMGREERIIELKERVQELENKLKSKKL
jgi:PAS domain S-box-containing protein